MKAKFRSIQVPLLLMALSVLVALGLRTTGHNQAFCFSKGKALSEEELAQKTRRSIIRFLIAESKKKAAEGWPGGYRVGIIYGSSDIDYIGNIKRSLSNTLPIEKNFHIHALVDGPGGDALSGVNAAMPMVIVDINNSGPGGGGITQFIDARDMRRAEWRRDIFAAKLSLIDKFHGYGRYFYTLKSVSINTQCCDSPYKYAADTNYQKIKEKTGRDTLSSFASGFAEWVDVVPVSDCGDVLVARNENNPRHHVVKVSHTQYKEKTQ